MFKITKRFIATILTLAMAFSMSGVVFAAPDVSVQLNGENMVFSASAKPIYRNDRVYVPFRSIFERLGAEIQYDEASNSITATKADTSIHFVIGSQDVTVTENGQKRVVAQAAAPFEENGNTYIPVRFAETFGCVVTWDDSTQTAYILDKSTVLDSLKGQFTIMDKMMGFNKKYAEGTYKFDGTITLDASVSDSGEEVPVTAKGTISGITDADKVNMNMALKLDTSVFKKFMSADELANPEVTKLISAVGNMEFDIIFDINTGKYYIKSPLITLLAGQTGDNWYVFDMNDILASTGSTMSFKALMEAAQGDSFEAYLMESLKMMPTDNDTNAQAFIQSVNLFKQMFGDDTFKKDANGYTSTYSMKENDIGVKMTTVINEKDAVVTGYSFAMNMYISGQEYLAMTAAQNGDDIDVNMSMNLADLFQMKLNLDMTMKESKDKINTQPPSGSNVISVNELMGL